MKKQYLAGLAVVGLVALCGTSHADLIVEGTGTMQGVAGSYQLIYDTDKNITWLDYTAPINTWQNQVNWASGLSVNVNGQNITGWRLPSTVDGPEVVANDGTTTAGWNITNSEIGHLYYAELGNNGYYDTNGNPQEVYGLTQTGAFANLVAYGYWSGTEYAANPDRAWVFATVDNGFAGIQVTVGNSAFFNALAVMPGQIQAASVPEPASMLLIGTGLTGLVGLKRRKK